MSDAVSSLLDGCLDDILSIREGVGAALYKIYIVTRTWSGSQIGDGVYTDVLLQIKPTPRIKDYSHDVRVMQGGAIQQGDILIQHISKQSYPLAAKINCQLDNPVVEKFYRFGGNDYRVISVKENLLTWDIQVRRLSDQTRRQ